ncbi:MAG TPA: single-stranded DNA-binding protein [Caldisericia bacterium]|nr:single-stranded DNA-binding protein [Caldisericia bacterium]HOR46241.1 single-stranded DNA-binding protein [Caldisericia bacterium]HOU08390.1 single-stranded DNA-binding protein [Caldisericia bacterium]HPL89547.1 single-stranded DNA-binding protein [Caldisericia bacterium]HQG59765.1 single-stranded DNA-binding protein [Caldisericia bacterium]
MYNKVLLIGNLTADPEIRYTPSGAPVTTIRLACTEKYRSKSSTELKEETLFINCIVWGNQATSAHQYLKKGSKCFVEGKLVIREYEKDGIRRWVTEVRVQNLKFLGSPTKGTSFENKGQPSQQQHAAEAEEDEFMPPDFNDEDIPFS